MYEWGWLGIYWGRSVDRRLVDNHQPAPGSTFGISGSSHETYNLCTPLDSMFGVSDSDQKTRSMCTSWKLHHMHIAEPEMPQRFTCKACELRNVRRSGRDPAVDSRAFQADTTAHSTPAVFRALKLSKTCFKAFTSLSSSLPGK